MNARILVKSAAAAAAQFVCAGLTLAQAQSKHQAAAQAAAQLKKTEELQRAHQEGIDTFQRAFAACMDSHNYSVE